MLSDETIFLSYNSADQEYVRKLAASLTVAGAHVWFDEWTIRPGDSIPGAIDEGLSQFDTFVLVWSEEASNSQWVKKEMDAALTRLMGDESLRIVPVILDATPLPPLLASIRYVDGRGHNQLKTTQELLGIESDAALRMAVQEFIQEAALDFREFAGIGVLVGCPRCGASAKNLEGWHAVDDERDDQYVGARCKVCGWNDGSEL